MSNLKTILIVDDGIRFVFSDVLEKAGYKVIEAENGIADWKFYLKSSHQFLLLPI